MADNCDGPLNETSHSDLIDSLTSNNFDKGMSHRLCLFSTKLDLLFSLDDKKGLSANNFFGDGATADSVDGPLPKELGGLDEREELTNGQASDDSGVPVNVEVYMKEIILSLIQDGVLVKKQISYHDCDTLDPSDSVADLNLDELPFDLVEAKVVVEEETVVVTQSTVCYKNQSIDEGTVKMAIDSATYKPHGNTFNRPSVNNEDKPSFDEKPTNSDCEISVSSHDDVTGNIGNNSSKCTVGTWVAVFSIVVPLVAGAIIIGFSWKNISVV